LTTSIQPGLSVILCVQKYITGYTSSHVFVNLPEGFQLQSAGDMITQTQAGGEYHLQGYWSPLPNVSAIIDCTAGHDG
jgi:hypothetical protein